MFFRIPEDSWTKHGNWRQTLSLELEALPEAERPGVVEITTTHWDLAYDILLQYNKRVQAHPTLENVCYYRHSLDGRALDALSFICPCQLDTILRTVDWCIEKGLEITDDWSLIITASEHNVLPC